jgi:hypothetical protein
MHFLRYHALMSLLLAGAQGTGCVMAPALPGGPMQGTSLQAEAAAAFSYAPGTVTANASDGTSEQTQGSGPTGLSIYRGELYPRLWTKTSSRGHLITSLGVSVGDRIQSLEKDTGGGEVDSEFLMIRDETRLEGALGLEIRNGLGLLSVVTLPYAVLDHGPTYNLEGESMLDLERTFGVAVFFKVGLSFTLHRFNGGVLPERRGSELGGLGE